MARPGPRPSARFQAYVLRQLSQVYHSLQSHASLTMETWPEYAHSKTPFPGNRKLQAASPSAGPKILSYHLLCSLILSTHGIKEFLWYAWSALEKHRPESSTLSRVTTPLEHSLSKEKAEGWGKGPHSYTQPPEQLRHGQYKKPLARKSEGPP